jgi:hypothetical protein
VESSAYPGELLTDPFWLRVKAGSAVTEKTEILKLSDRIPFVLREDQLSAHHIAAISKTKRIKNETMESLGQIAYEAYATEVDWKSPFTEQTLKEWDTLMIMNPIVAAAWECAALMVAAQPPVKVGPEQTQMSTIGLIDIRLTTPGESIGTVVSTHETIRPAFKANEAFQQRMRDSGSKDN